MSVGQLHRSILHALQTALTANTMQQVLCNRHLALHPRHGQGTAMKFIVDSFPCGGLTLKTSCNVGSYFQHCQGLVKAMNNLTRIGCRLVGMIRTSLYTDGMGRTNPNTCWSLETRSSNRSGRLVSLKVRRVKKYNTGSRTIYSIASP